LCEKAQDMASAFGGRPPRRKVRDRLGQGYADFFPLPVTLAPFNSRFGQEQASPT